MQPASYPKRILIAVSGMTPQIVTETMYALATNKVNPFIPTEIHLITTREGADVNGGAFPSIDGEYQIKKYYALAVE